LAIALNADELLALGAKRSQLPDTAMPSQRQERQPDQRRFQQHETDVKGT